MNHTKFKVSGTLCIFCPRCQRYLGKRDHCSCGWVQSKREMPAVAVELPASIIGPIVVEKEQAIVGYGSGNGTIGGVVCVDLGSQIRNAVRWKAEVGSAVQGGVTVCADRVIFGDVRGRVHARRLDNGQPAWASPLGLDGAILSAPQIASVNAYVGTSRGIIYCLDWRSGRMVHQKPLSGHSPRSRPRIVAAPVLVDKQVWCGTYDGHIYALTMDLEHVTDAYDAGGEIRTRLQVVGRSLVFGTNAGTLHAVNTRTGQDVWPPFCARQGIPVAPFIHKNTLYVTSLDHVLYAIDWTTGQSRWQVDLGHGLATTPAWIDGGWVVVGTNRGDIVAVDVERQAVVWRYAVHDGQLDEHGRPFRVWGGPTVYDSRVYAGASDGRLYVLSWHGAAWKDASDTLLRVGQVEEAAACLIQEGEFDAERRAAKLLEQRGCPELAARAFLALDQKGNAARAFIKAAQAAMGASAGSYWDKAAQIFFDLQELDRARACQRNAARARGDPFLEIQWIGDSAFRQEEASQVQLCIKNVAVKLAKNIHISATGAGFALARPCRLAELGAQCSRTVCLERLVPRQAGTLTLHIEISWETSGGRNIVLYPLAFRVQVAAQGQPPSITNIENQFNGTIDVVEGDQVRIERRGQEVRWKQNGRVSQVRTEENPRSGRQRCVHCQAVLVPGATSCSNCGERVQ